MPSRGPESATFLYALARRIAIRLVVLVPVQRRARVLWLVRGGSDAEVEGLEGLGQAVLRAGDEVLRDWTAARTSEYTDDKRMAVAVVCAPDGDIAGVLVGQKDSTYGWSRSEQALLEFTADFYAQELTRCVSRPRPSRAMDVEPGWRRAEADDLESGMRLAADKGELFLLYQPEVDLNTGEVVAVEALTRWLHPQRGELGPDSFIALAEQSELIQVLGAWLIEESFRDFGSWQQALHDAAVALRVNVSPAQLSRPGVPEQFAAALRRHGLRGEQICVELTENLEVLDVPSVARALEELRKLGIKAAIDDLGSGYSGLSRLRTFEVDFVKLDRGLVQGIDRDPRARAIVRGVVATATELGMSVIAEGVEDQADAETLRALGCHSAQGHYFARPMSGSDALAYLAEHGRRKDV
jgi:EAL domain-containing protein (putative c-di-GMP-specific phosphodiesterase class I)